MACVGSVIKELFIPIKLVPLYLIVIPVTVWFIWTCLLPVGSMVNSTSCHSQLAFTTSVR